MTQRKHDDTTAIDKIHDALDALDSATRCRVLAYVNDTYEDELAGVDEFRWHTVSGEITEDAKAVTVGDTMMPTDDPIDLTDTNDPPITVERRK